MWENVFTDRRLVKRTEAYFIYALLNYNRSKNSIVKLQIM